MESTLIIPAFVVKVSHLIVYNFSKIEETRAVTECDLIPLPVLRQKIVFSTQTDTRMDGHTDGQTSRFQYTPKNICFVGV